MSLSAVRTNRAIKLYERLGFRIIDPDATPIIDMVWEAVDGQSPGTRPFSRRCRRRGVHAASVHSARIHAARIHATSIHPARVHAARPAARPTQHRIEQHVLEHAGLDIHADRVVGLVVGPDHDVVRELKIRLS